MARIELQDFQGRWRIDRRIEDRRLGLSGRFEGEAVFAPEGCGLRQTETGILRFGEAAPMQASRVYHWHSAGDRIVLTFEDGRDFHDFSPRRGAEAVHLCGADTYRVRYGFGDWPVWTSVWIVTGPRKDLTLRTVFSR